MFSWGFENILISVDKNSQISSVSGREEKWISEITTKIKNRLNAGLWYLQKDIRDRVYREGN